MRLSVVIVTYNSASFIKDCIASILNKKLRCEYEIIVVDNNSKDDTLNIIKDNFPGVKVIRNNKNYGFARAINQGIRMASGKYLLLLNHDTKLLNNNIDAILDYMDGHLDVGLCGPGIENEDLKIICSYSLSKNFRQHRIEMLKDALYLKRLSGFLKQAFVPNKAPIEVGYVNGCAMFVRKSAIKSVGLLDERFFFCAEEVDWAFRFNQKGFKVIYYPALRILHYVGSKQQLTLWSILQYHKSHIKLFKKYNRKIGKYYISTIFCIWLATRFIISSLCLLFGIGNRALAKHRCVVYFKALIWHTSLQKINFNLDLR